MAVIVNGLLYRDGGVLLARRSSERDTYPGTWSFPGGHVEIGESLDLALRRELSEELGVQITSWSYFWRILDKDTFPGRTMTFHLFVVDGWTGMPELIGDEHVELTWKPVLAAMDMPNLTFPEYVDVFEALNSGMKRQQT